MSGDGAVAGAEEIVSPPTRNQRKFRKAVWWGIAVMMALTSVAIGPASANNERLDPAYAGYKQPSCSNRSGYIRTKVSPDWHNKSWRHSYTTRGARRFSDKAFRISVSAYIIGYNRIGDEYASATSRYYSRCYWRTFSRRWSRGRMITSIGSRRYRERATVKWGQTWSVYDLCVSAGVGPVSVKLKCRRIHDGPYRDHNARVSGYKSWW